MMPSEFQMEIAKIIIFHQLVIDGEESWALAISAMAELSF
jgi:hypothetical protein